MFGLFRKVDERALANAVVAFGSGFYKSVRQHMDAADVDVAVMRSEFPLVAIAVTTAFVGMRRKNHTKLMATTAQHAAMAYGVQMERITNGQVVAGEYAVRLTQGLADGRGMEYVRIVCEDPPEDQPKRLISHYLMRLNTSIPAGAIDTAINGVAASLSKLIDDMRHAGI
ncbi:hypothetical protein KVP10_17970 [Candidimonas humi]|uniref:Uncharacterized protein n=1 Tax=Candidimonas humi TaxID=683355 RepID=A0ABV8P2G9_9BURK|nr:hypothetical protein [Candidimonas humi]MBV6306779.1 hypothetical protein [Candidimonas humi]